MLTLNSGKRVAKTTLKVATEPVTSRLTPRLFGEAVVRRLEDSGSKQTKMLQAFAGYYRISRQTMSLLMLESKQDYERFKIVRNVNYSEAINRLQVGKLIAKISWPEPVKRALPVIEHNQLADMQYIFASLMVCRAPDKLLKGIAFDKLVKTPSVHAIPLKLQEEDVQQGLYSIDLKNSARAYKDLLEKARMLVAKNKKVRRYECLVLLLIIRE